MAVTVIPVASGAHPCDRVAAFPSPSGGVVSFEAITRLIIRYSHLLDDQNWEEWSTLWADDCVMSMRGAQHRGREAITQAVSQIQPSTPGKHLTGVPVVDMKGPDRAEAWTDMIAVIPRDGQLVIAGVSRYHDDIVLSGGSWVFRERRMYRPGADIPGYGG
jgi:hypothetical protein